MNLKKHKVLSFFFKNFDNHTFENILKNTEISAEELDVILIDFKDLREIVDSHTDVNTVVSFPITYNITTTGKSAFLNEKYIQQDERRKAEGAQRALNELLEKNLKRKIKWFYPLVVVTIILAFIDIAELFEILNTEQPKELHILQECKVSPIQYDTIYVEHFDSLTIVK